MVAEAVASQLERAERRGVRLIEEADDVDDPAEVEVAVPELTRVLHNVLDNAIRHTPAGGVVAVHVRTADGQATVSVEDQCGGIPEADLERVFDVAFRGDAARGPRASRAADWAWPSPRGLSKRAQGAIDVDNVRGRMSVHRHAAAHRVTAPADRVRRPLATAIGLCRRVGGAAGDRGRGRGRVPARQSHRGWRRAVGGTLGFRLVADATSSGGGSGVGRCKLVRAAVRGDGAAASGRRRCGTDRSRPHVAAGLGRPGRHPLDLATVRLRRTHASRGRLGWAALVPAALRCRTNPCSRRTCAPTRPASCSCCGSSNGSALRAARFTSC